MKNLTKTTLTMLAVGLLSGSLFCQQAQATQVNGYLYFGGTVTLDSTTLTSATQVTAWNTMFVNRPGTDSFSGIPVGTNATMSGPWTFNSGSHPSLWSAGGFTYDLTGSAIVYQISTFLNVSGAGIVSGNGFIPSTADWAFTITTDGTPHANRRFDFTAQIFAEHPPDCVYFPSFWRCHPEAWCTQTIQLGAVTYTKDQAETILHELARRNGLIALAQGIITAKLNIECNHSDDSCISQTINDSDSLIGNLIVPPFGNGYLSPSAVSNLVTVLTQYNTGHMCAHRCADPPCSTPTPTPTP